MTRMLSRVEVDGQRWAASVCERGEGEERKGMERRGKRKEKEKGNVGKRYFPAFS